MAKAARCGHLRADEGMSSIRNRIIGPGSPATRLRRFCDAAGEQLSDETLEFTYTQDFEWMVALNEHARRAHWRWGAGFAVAGILTGVLGLLQAHYAGSVGAFALFLLAFVFWRSNRDVRSQLETLAAKSPRTRTSREITVSFSPSGFRDRSDDGFSEIPWSAVRSVERSGGAIEVRGRSMIWVIPEGAVDDPKAVVEVSRAWIASDKSAPTETFPGMQLLATWVPVPETSSHFRAQLESIGEPEQNAVSGRVFLSVVAIGVVWCCVHTLVAAVIGSSSHPWPTLAFVSVVFGIPCLTFAFARDFLERITWPLLVWWAPVLGAEFQLFAGPEGVVWRHGPVLSSRWRVVDSVTWTDTLCIVTVEWGQKLVVPREAFSDGVSAERDMKAWMEAAHAASPLPAPEAVHVPEPDNANPFAAPTKEEKSRSLFSAVNLFWLWVVLVLVATFVCAGAIEWSE